MKIIIPLLFLFTFCTYSLASDVPISIGMGDDTVWLKTGKRPTGRADSIILPEYNIVIVYGPEKTVESILMSQTFLSAGKIYTLNGIGLGENKKDVLNKLGEPTKVMPKDEEEVEDVSMSIWVLKDQILEVAFWRADQFTPDKHVKDSVAWVKLRKAHF